MKVCLFLFLLFVSFAGYSQHQLTGKVVSETGTALVKASVFIPNSTIGVYTNEAGEFTITNLPAGPLQFVVSYIGYQVFHFSLSPDSLNRFFLVKLTPETNKLQDVVVNSYDRNGWNKWGDDFLAAFIGTSAFAPDCIIQNTKDIRFVYSEKTKELQAFCPEPLIILNKALGYQLRVNLVDFRYNVTNKFVDYQTYTLFEEENGTDDEKRVWKNNRADVYKLSLLKFMRSFFSPDFDDKTYEVRIVEKPADAEKQRIKQLYETTYHAVTDSLQKANRTEGDINHLVETAFPKDSLSYYTRILAQPVSGKEKQHRKPATFGEIAYYKDSNLVILTCPDYLRVINTEVKEPKEYAAFMAEANAGSNRLASVIEKANGKEGYPVTELSLRQGVPLKIYRNGYYSNVDLFMNGFWGWWEKMATKLPYNYEP